MQYHPEQIESKWRRFWTENKIYRTSTDTSKPKYYVLDMFPYPSGAGLHVGHPLGYIASDIFARYKKLSGFNVLHPMGYDAFGLPAEQYAIQTGVHPSISTEENINRYREQLDNIGFSFDWDREVRTSDPAYYKWTQWIFLQLFHHYYNVAEAKADSIESLIQSFETNGNAKVQAVSTQDTIFTAAEWNKMTAKEKDDVLMNYRLAYRKTGYVNWCEALGTVLANDEIKDGVSERGGHPVEKKAMMQWSLRITAYAERLLNDLDQLEWSDALKAMQRNWIGKSEGAQMFFELSGHEEKIEIFTTRPDTIFGATFMVLAPEHDLVPKITTTEQKETIDTYLHYVSSRSEVDRMAEVKEVSGAFTGAYAINPFTHEKIPVWIGEYVLKDYGTGAIMAVPSDDERDQLFARKYKLQIVDVVDKSDYPGSSLHDKTGKIINSAFLNGMEVQDAIRLMFDKIEQMGIGKRKINYKLRDANFSRQRYWGEPFPIIYDQDGVTKPLPESELPLELPELEDYRPASGGRSPLARLDNWVNLPNGNVRETDTMPGFAGSSWYFLRYMDAANPNEFASEDALSYWQDVDLYVGGTEHAVGHLMYSRFWHKVLFDLGFVPTQEPFKKLINQGMIQGVIAYILMQKDRVDGKIHFLSADMLSDSESDTLIKVAVHVDFVKDHGTPKAHLDTYGIRQLISWRPEYADAVFETSQGIMDGQNISMYSGYEPESFRFQTISEVGKMSKRYYNVVNPDDVVARYGADCFRMYEMFLGPVEQSKPWDTNGIEGVQKFLRKFWSLYFNDKGLYISDEPATTEELKILHQAIKKVTDDIERFSFNTAVSAFMVCTNELKRINCNKKSVLKPLLQLLAPFAPFITEEIWLQMGEEGTIHHSAYPKFDASCLESDEIEYPVSINGKKRDNIRIPSDASNEEIQEMVLQSPLVKKWLEGNTVKKCIIVPKRMINLVI